MNTFQKTSQGVIIWDKYIFSAESEIKNMVERILSKHKLAFDVEVVFERHCIEPNGWYGSLSVVFFLPNNQMLGMVEYVSDQSYLDNTIPDFYCFRWNSSTNTRIPGDEETLEEHVRRIIENRI